MPLLDVGHRVLAPSAGARAVLPPAFAVGGIVHLQCRADDEDDERKSPGSDAHRNRGKIVEQLHGTRGRQPGNGCIQLLLPRGLDLEPIVGKRRVAGMEYLISRIIWEGVRDRRKRGRYVRLQAAFLRRMVGRDYAGCVARAAEAGILQVDPAYSVGRYSRGYRLSPKWRRREIETHSLGCKKLHKKLLALMATEERDLITPSENDLADNLHDLRVDEDAALDAAMIHHGEGRRFRQLVIDHIARRIWGAKVCTFGHRFHSTLCYFPRDLRQFLSVQGEALAWLDIANSQPLIASWIVCEEAARSCDATYVSPRALPGPYMLAETACAAKRSSGAVSLCGRRYRGCMLPADVVKYADLCETGKLYDYLEKEDGQELGREQIKNDLFRRVFFCRDSPQVLESPLRQLFASQFPTVDAVVSGMKRRHGHKSVARRLQRKESAIMKEGFGNAWRETAGGRWWGLVYDAILVRESDAEAARDVLMDVLERNGLRATIRVDRYQ